MPKYRVIRATIDSATGKQYKVDDIATIDLPMVIPYDVRGVACGEGKPMRVSSNLELIVEAEPERPMKIK